MERTRTLPKAAQKQLDNFVLRVMEPLTASELVDTQYNLIVRQTRGRAWKSADLTRQYYEALHTLASVAECPAISGRRLPLLSALPERLTAVDRYRQAVAEQILTPASQKLDLDWKKRQDISFLPITEKAYASALKADEDFLAAHPVKKARRAK
jgi:hypothetical protein